jgi:hypothetical protein
MFSSPSRLDLSITVGPEKPGHIKTILSGHLPIILDYRCMDKEITGSALWRMRAVLKHHHDRVRKITFEGTGDNFDEFCNVTDCAFPVLESLVLDLKRQPKLPDTFLGGPDLSYLHLRCLKLNNVSLASVSRLLFSLTDLTDLSLKIDIDFSPFPKKTLFACFQGLPSLRSLNLYVPSQFPSHPPAPKDIVTLSKLASFSCIGYSTFLDDLVIGLSAPSLKEVNIEPIDEDWPATVHLPRFISEIEEHYHTIHVAFLEYNFHLSLLTQSEYTDHCKSCIDLGPVMGYSPESIMLMSGALSTRLTIVEELLVTFDDNTDANTWENFIPWCRFLQQFPRVKALLLEGANTSYIASNFLRYHEEPGALRLLPALEEIELPRFPLSIRERRPQLAAFRPFVAARREAGRPVKVFFSA